MLIQHWTLEVTASHWLNTIRMIIALSLAAYAGWILAFVTGIIGIGGWWGDWLWPWPVLLYLSWMVACLPAPLLTAMQTFTLTESGELGDHQIRHSLRTPWLIALQLSLLSVSRDGAGSIENKPHWVWVVRDQLTEDSWTRLNRACQNAATSAGRLP